MSLCFLYCVRCLLFFLFVLLLSFLMNKDIYTVIGTLAVDGWAVIFGTARRWSLLDTERNQARSKPDPVDRPVRTAPTTVHHYTDTHYC